MLLFLEVQVFEVLAGELSSDSWDRPCLEAWFLPIAQ